MIKTAIKLKETDIRAQLRDFLKISGWLVTIHYQGPLSAKGFPDMTALKDGNTVYIEVKSEGGTQSPYQKIYQREIEQHGGEYILARCLEDVVHLCEDILKFG